MADVCRTIYWSTPYTSVGRTTGLHHHVHVCSKNYRSTSYTSVGRSAGLHRTRLFTNDLPVYIIHVCRTIYQPISYNYVGRTTGLHHTRLQDDLPVHIIHVCRTNYRSPIFTTLSHAGRVSTQGRFRVWPWLSEFSGGILSCFTLSSSAVCTDGSLNYHELVLVKRLGLITR